MQIITEDDFLSNIEGFKGYSSSKSTPFVVCINYLLVCLPLCLSVCQSLYLFVCLHVCLSVCMYISLSITSDVRLSAALIVSASPSICPYTCYNCPWLALYPSFQPSVCSRSVCLCVCLSVSVCLSFGFHD